MLGLRESEDFQPIGWIGKYPIHAATLLVIIHVLAMVAETIAAASRIPIPPLAFSSPDIFKHFAFWEFLTYPFVHAPSLWFAVEMYLLFSFGREVEKFLGRRAFLKLYLVLLLASPCLLTAWGFFTPIRSFAGSGQLHLAVFVAFATLYPNTQIFFSFITKWVAFVILGIYSLQALAAHDPIGLSVLWLSAGIAYAFIRRIRGQEILPGLPSREPRFRVVEKRPGRKPRREEDPLSVIDPLLDKIAREGLESLTQRERERLESARKRMLKKGG